MIHIPPFILFIILLLLTTIAYYLGRRWAYDKGKECGGLKYLHSKPVYHGGLALLTCAIPAFVVFGLWLVIEPEIITHMVVSGLPAEMRNLPAEKIGLIVNDIKNLVRGYSFGEPSPAIQAAAEHYKNLKTISHAMLTVLSILLGMLGIVAVKARISKDLRARNRVESIIRIILIVCSSIAILITIGIVLSVLFEAIRFFKVIPITDFLFGLKWSPQIAIRADQVGSTGAFGAVPIFWGTFLISAIAMLVALPLGLLSAIYLTEYAGKKFHDIAKPLLEILAGIPTVVYGFFAALVVAPALRNLGLHIGLDVSSESALAAGLVMGVMIIPFISSLSDDAINAVPQALRDGAYALGATQSEIIKNVVVPAALPGICGGALLAISRAIGETMIVVMAAGLSANMTINPLQAVTTVTVQIVSLLVGDQEFDDPKTLAAFALGLVLFVATLCLNILALYIVRKYREQYE